MENYELEREAEQARKRAANAQADLEQKELEREREERAARVAKDRASAMQRQLEAERVENEENNARQWAEAQELRDRIKRLEHEKGVVVGALRALVAALPANQKSALIYFAGTPLAKSCEEAVELLAVLDAQK